MTYYVVHYYRKNGGNGPVSVFSSLSEVNNMIEAYRKYDAKDGESDLWEYKIVIVEPVLDKHGYNKEYGSPSLFECSVCGWGCWDTYCGDTPEYNYCPHCGAKMDGFAEVQA